MNELPDDLLPNDPRRDEPTPEDGVRGDAADHPNADGPKADRDDSETPQTSGTPDAEGANDVAATPGRPRRRRRRNDGDMLPAAAKSLLESLHEPWLLAAWPGMGGVAAIAAGHLAQTLGAQPVGMLSLADHFPLDGVDVQRGIARANPTPRCLLLAWKDPAQKRDLLLLLGEAQPPNGGAEICRKIMDMAEARGVKRVVTFAAMGSDLDPTRDPRVLGATTDPTLLENLNESGVERLGEGQISGLNGALLAVAADRGVPAVCLLGEMPTFAAGMPNPRSSMEVLKAFGRLAHLEIDIGRLAEQASQLQPRLEQLHNQMIDLTGQEPQDEPSEPTPPAAPSAARPEDVAGSQEPVKPKSARPRIDDAARDHLERLFTRAREDRTEAQRLKAELDRLGVFADYEDRFLDLFRRPS